MAGLERDLDRVLADQAHVLDSQLIVGEVLDPSEPASRTAFAATLRARARPSQLFAGIGAVVPILPGDLHDLTFAVDVDVEGERIGVFQLWLPMDAASGR
jgi:hypothetical protein